jgi:transposase
VARFDLTDREWAVIVPLLLHKPLVDVRRGLNGILWTLRTRSPWRARPERYGPYTTVYNR